MRNLTSGQFFGRSDRLVQGAKGVSAGVIVRSDRLTVSQVFEGVKAVDVKAQSLCAEIGRGVDQYHAVVESNQN